MIGKLIRTGKTGGDADAPMSYKEIEIVGAPEVIFFRSHRGKPYANLVLSCIVVTNSGERYYDHPILWTDIKADIERGYLKLIATAASKPPPTTKLAKGKFDEMVRALQHIVEGGGPHADHL